MGNHLVFEIYGWATFFLDKLNPKSIKNILTCYSKYFSSARNMSYTFSFKSIWIRKDAFIVEVGVGGGVKYDGMLDWGYVGLCTKQDLKYIS